MPVKLANNYLATKHSETRSNNSHIEQSDNLRYPDSSRDMFKVQNNEIDLSTAFKRGIVGGTDPEQPQATKPDLKQTQP